MLSSLAFSFSTGSSGSVSLCGLDGLVPVCYLQKVGRQAGEADRIEYPAALPGPEERATWRVAKKAMSFPDGIPTLRKLVAANREDGKEQLLPGAGPDLPLFELPREARLIDEKPYRWVRQLRERTVSIPERAAAGLFSSRAYRLGGVGLDDGTWAVRYQEA